MALLERAVEIDPEFASAWGGIAFSMYVLLLLDPNADRETLLSRGLEAGLTGVRLDHDDPFALQRPLCQPGNGRFRLNHDGLPE